MPKSSGNRSRASTNILTNWRARAVHRIVTSHNAPTTTREPRFRESSLSCRRGSVDTQTPRVKVSHAMKEIETDHLPTVNYIILLDVTFKPVSELEVYTIIVSWLSLN